MGDQSIGWLKILARPANLQAPNPTWQPLVDVYRVAHGWLIKYDLAGVLPQDVSLTIDGPCLILRGRRRDCSIEEGCCHYRMEISYSHFERTP